MWLQNLFIFLTHSFFTIVFKMYIIFIIFANKNNQTTKV